LAHLLIKIANKRNRNRQISTAVVLAAALAGSFAGPGIAGDWGYDDPVPAKPAAASGGPTKSSAAVPTSIQPATKPKSVNRSGGGANLFSRGAASTIVPARGTVVPNGPFDNVQTGAGNYGVELNPPSYEKAATQHRNGDVEDEVNSRSTARERGTAGGVKSKPIPAVVPISATAAKAAYASDSQALVKECWRQIFQIAAGSKLSDEQSGAIDVLVAKRLASGPQASSEAKAVLTFWPPVTTYLAAHPEQKENYSMLLRALLRWRARMQSQSLGDLKLDELAKSENGLITEVLGPVRIAVDDEPPFTEEAVNAYTDMACFIFEQRHPEKSVNGDDNRKLFAQVVCEKYHRAPTEKDRAGMVGFDLSWAKFKIAYQAADDAGRGILLSKLAGQGAGVAWAHVKDPVLEQVLGKWPAPKTAPPVEPMLAKAQSYGSASAKSATPAKPGGAKAAPVPASTSPASPSK
jgi:hypothetical protein